MLEEGIGYAADRAPPAQTNTFAVDEIVPTKRAHTCSYPMQQAGANTLDRNRYPIRLSLAYINRHGLEDSKATPGSQAHEERPGRRANSPDAKDHPQRLYP